MARFYTQDELNALDKEALETIAEARGLEIEGSGSNGNVVKDDLVAAITANQDTTGVNPALAPEPMEPEAHTYKVVGPHEVHGHAPGETFEMVLPPDQEELLLQSGALILTTKEGA